MHRAELRPGGILVIGEALVDVVVTDSGAVEHPGGSPANVALGLGRLGLSPQFLTVLGRDDRGYMVADHLEESGVEVLASSFSAERTATATALLGEDGAAQYRFDISWDLPDLVTAGAPRLIHTGSIAAFLEPGARAVRELLPSADLVTFDPNIRPALLGTVDETRAAFESIAALATVVKLSDEDAVWLYPGHAPGDVLNRIIGLGPRVAVETLAERGALLFTSGLQISVPAAATAVVDTIGAGDTYMATLIAALLAWAAREPTHHELERAGRRAAFAAAITVGRQGADLPWLHELPEQDEHRITWPRGPS